MCQSVDTRPWQYSKGPSLVFWSADEPLLSFFTSHEKVHATHDHRMEHSLFGNPFHKTLLPLHRSERRDQSRSHTEIRVERG